MPGAMQVAILRRLPCPGRTSVLPASMPRVARGTGRSTRIPFRPFNRSENLAW